MPRRADGLGIIPLALLLHNVEEAVAIPAMLGRTRQAAARVLGAGATLPSEEQYLVALAVLTAAVFLLWLASFRWERLAYPLVLFQATMVVNIASHVAGAIALGGYSPGLVTSVTVQGAAGVVVYRRMRRAGWMSRRQWVLLPVGALGLHGPVALGLAALILF